MQMAKGGMLYDMEVMNELMAQTYAAAIRWPWNNRSIRADPTADCARSSSRSRARRSRERDRSSSVPSDSLADCSHCLRLRTSADRALCRPPGGPTACSQSGRAARG